MLTLGKHLHMKQGKIEETHNVEQSLHSGCLQWRKSLWLFYSEVDANAVIPKLFMNVPDSTHKLPHAHEHRVFTRVMKDLIHQWPLRQTPWNADIPVLRKCWHSNLMEMLTSQSYGRCFWQYISMSLKINGITPHSKLLCNRQTLSVI